MEKRRLIPSFALLALLLGSCNGTNSQSSSSSSSEIIAPSTYFALFQSSGEAYYRSDNVGTYSDDYSGEFSGVSKDNQGTETSFDSTADNLVIDSRYNNINSTKGSDLDAYLVFDGGPVTVSSGTDEGVAYKWTNFRPRLYLDDDKLFMDLSENPSLRLALNWLVRLETGDSTWSFPQSGLGYADVDQSSLDSEMPLGGRFDDGVSAYRQSLEDAYADYPGDFTFTHKDETYTIVYSTTDKTHIRDFVIEEVEKENADWTDRQKTDLETSIGNLAEASTVKKFSLSFSYSSLTWFSRSFDIDISYDLETQKTSDPSQNFYPTLTVANGVFSFSSGETAKITFPSDMDTTHYTKLTLPIIDFGGGAIG